MKKLLVIPFFALLSVSCSKTPQSQEPDIKETTYTIINDTYFRPADQYLDGSMYEVIVYEYNGDEIVGHSYFECIASKGKSKPIVVNEDCEKVKISFKMLPVQSPHYYLPSNGRLYVVDFAYMQPDENSNIVIDNDTKLSASINSEANFQSFFFRDLINLR